jgi:hypothetical protein
MLPALLPTLLPLMGIPLLLARSAGVCIFVRELGLVCLAAPSQCA